MWPSFCCACQLFYKIWAGLGFVEDIGIFGIDFKMNSQWVPNREDAGKGIVLSPKVQSRLNAVSFRGVLADASDISVHNSQLLL